MENVNEALEALVEEFGAATVKQAIEQYRGTDGGEPGCQPPGAGCGTGKVWNALQCACVDDLGFNPPPQE
jgi:hypothetical protein